MPSHHSSIVDSSDNSAYRMAFYMKSLLLLTYGHERLIAEGLALSKSEEPEITGELVRCTKEYLDDATSPEWTLPFEIVEESPENTKGRKGKSRKKVDVVCTLTQRKPRLRIKFEAKRLNNVTHPVAIYLGKEGLQEFLIGSYAPECDVAGMLGYVQSNDCTYWIKQIRRKLQENRIQLEQAGFQEIQNCYKSAHHRSASPHDILIYHLLLQFQQ